jgi:xylulokinase
VLLDENDQVLPPVLHMFDTRCGTEVGELNARFRQRFGHECFNGCSSLWTYPQLLWIRKNCPGVWRRVRHVLFPKDYVRHRLAPGYVTDYIDADGTLFYNPIKREWIADFIADLGLPAGVWPRTCAPTEIVAQLSSRGAVLSGLMTGTPFIAGTTDTAAEVLGCGAVRPGDAVVKLASVGRLAFITREPMWQPGMITYPHVLDGLWYPGTAAKHAASAYKWLRQVFWPSGEPAPPDAFARMDARAAQAPSGCDGLVFLPHLAGAWSPVWDDAREAAFCGVRARHQQAHFARAVLEGVAFSLKSAWRSLEAAGMEATNLRLIGAGARSSLWREIVADVIGRPLVVPVETEAVRGTALLTAMGVGALPQKAEAVLAQVGAAAEITPQPERVRQYEELFSRYEKFETALAPR